MLRIFLREKPTRVLIILKDVSTPWHLSKIAVATGTTYVYVTHLISDLERRGFVITEQRGKKRLVRLTEKGLIIVNIMEELKQKIEEKQQAQTQ